MANCWVCESGDVAKSHSRYRGVCQPCGERLRKKFGSGQWEAVAREAIKMGNRESLLAYVPCRGCGKKRVRQNASKSMLCRSCNDKAKIAAMTEEERQAWSKDMYRKELARRRRKLEELQARLAKVTRPSVAACSAIPDGPWQTALREARKDPKRHVIPVAMGGNLVGTTLYFEPVVKPDGTIGVRQLSNW